MALQDDAFDTEAILLGDEGQIMIFGGHLDPHLVEPNAPVGAVYFKSNGKIFSKKTVGTFFTNWEENDSGSGSGATGELPFYDDQGVQDNIALIGGQLPFYDAAGVYDPIDIL